MSKANVLITKAGKTHKITSAGDVILLLHLSHEEYAQLLSREKSEATPLCAKCTFTLAVT